MPNWRAPGGDALAKIEAVLPHEMEDAARTSGLLAGPRGIVPHRALVRRAETKLRLGYTDKHQAASTRIVWPIAIGFFHNAEVLAAWCEAPGAFRHFRLDRIATAEAMAVRMPRRRRMLLAEWRLDQGIDGEF